MVKAATTPQDRMRLDDAVIVVTGAGGWIGAGIARSAARAGARLVLHYRSAGEAARALADELGAGGTEVATAQADIAEETGARAIVDAAVSAFGRLDGVVNNAGIQPLSDLLSLSAEAFREVVDVNLTGTHLVTVAAVRRMVEQGTGGSIVQIASLEGSQPARNHGHYNAAKAGVINHARAAALEFGEHGIRVNCVSPGVIGRPGIEDAWPDGVHRYTSASPLGRLGAPQDVGDACVFLLSDAAAWITGINLPVDGGVSSHPTY